MRAPASQKPSFNKRNSSHVAYIVYAEGIVDTERWKLAPDEVASLSLYGDLGSAVGGKHSLEQVNTSL